MPKSKSVQVTTIGSATEDLIFLTTEASILPGHSVTCEKYLAFEYGAKIPIGKIKTCLGGASANVACGLAKLEVETRPCAAIGGDDTGIRIKRALTKAGINTNLIHPIHSSESDRSIILVEPKDRDRTIFYSRDAGNFLKLKDISQWKTQWVFVSSLNLGWEKKLGQILKLRKDKGTKIAFNPGKLQIKAGMRFLFPLLRETSILILNWDEALELALSAKEFSQRYTERAPSKKSVIKFIQSNGPKVVIITLGKKGSIATDGYYYYKAPALSPKRLEITGAGDSYSSGFLASWIYDCGNIKRAMGWGMANAGSVVMYFGAQKGLLDRYTMRRKVNEVLINAMIEETTL